jgi:hypothetical protein
VRQATWLAAQKNVTGAANENLARQFMELFTLGRGDGYTETDVREGSRALAGWRVRADGSTYLVPRLHDSGSKPSWESPAIEKAEQQSQLTQLDTAVGHFFDTLASSPHGKDVVLVAYSEFGRRVAANASQGTDLGTAGPVSSPDHRSAAAFTAPLRR